MRIMGKLIFSLLVVITSFWSMGIQANEGERSAGKNACVPVLRGLGTQPAFAKDPVTGEWKLLVEPLKYGADGRPHGRGFLSSYPTESEVVNDASAQEFILNNGLKWWTLRILVVPNLKAVSEELKYPHFSYKSGGFDDTVMPIVYVAGDDFERIKGIAQDFGFSQKESEAFQAKHRKAQKNLFDKMIAPLNFKTDSLESRLYYISHVDYDSNGKAEYKYSRLPYSEIRRLNFESSRLYWLVEGGRARITQMFYGWTKLPIRGVVRLQDYFENNDRVREIERQTRKFFKEGVIGSITFNTPHGMVDVIELARDTDRKGQEPGGGAGAHKRFNPDYIKKYVNGLKTNITYSVEVRDPKGKVIGGGFGDIAGGVFDGQSPAYPRLLKWKKDKDGNLILQDGLPVPLYEINKETGETLLDKEGKPVQSFYGIEIARIAKYFLFKRMLQAGFIIQDAIQVTEFTKGLGGVYITNEEFNEIKRISKERGVDGTKVDWSPITEPPEVRKSK